MLRLAKAQGEMVRSLEARLALQERKLADCTAAWTEIDRLASSGGSGRLAFLPGALRSLAAAEVAVRDARVELEHIRSQLLTAKARHKALDQRARILRDAGERKSGEENALEAALIMAAKASRKPYVVN